MSDKNKQSIRKFYELLKDSHDEPLEAYKFVTFLRTLLRDNTDNTLPLVEIMTVIKQEKPIIYSQLKKMAPYNTMIEILTDLSINIEDARNRLENMISDITEESC